MIPPLGWWLEEAGIAHVLAVESDDKTLLTHGMGGVAWVAPRQLAQQIPHTDWQRLSAGEGRKKEPRLYDWARVSPRSWTHLEERHCVPVQVS